MSSAYNMYNQLTPELVCTSSLHRETTKYKIKRATIFIIIVSYAILCNFLQTMGHSKSSASKPEQNIILI